MNPLLQQFLIEARDFLEQIGQKLLLLEEEPGNEDVIGEIFRAVHTLKGNSGLFDMPSLTSVVHAAEDLLDRVRDGTMEIDPELTDALLGAMDFVSQMLDDVESTGTIGAEHSGRSAEFARDLRRRLPAAGEAGATSDAEEISQVAAPSDWTWLGNVPEGERLTAHEGFAGPAPLTAIRYRPEADCFFRGEDPLMLARTTPGLMLFDLATFEPWPDASALDVYSCNLQFDLVAAVDRAEIQHHFRYVTDQIALYDLPSHALAMPVGEEEDGGGATMIGPIFLEQARERLVAGDRAGLLNAAETALDLMNPSLRAASVLRWLRRLIESDAPYAVLSHLVETLAKGATPDWHALASGPVVTSGTPATGAAPSPAPAWQPSLDPQSMQLWSDLVAAQITMLSLRARAPEFAGRVRSAQNALAGLFRAAGHAAGYAGLDAAVDRTLAEGDVAPLEGFVARMLDGDGGSLKEVDVPPLQPALELAETPPRPPAPPELVLVEAEPVAAREVSEPLDGGKRSSEPGSGIGVRVLKVPQEKVDRLMDLIGEMVVAKNALPYLAARAEDHFGSRELSREIKSQYAIINRIAEEMQDGIMQVRMLPVGAVFQRFPRLVRDVARQLGKTVRLVVEGEETEADKNIVESLADPMIHILRNSLDHGLETPDRRRSQGKPDEGRLTVRASQEGDRVLIEVEDDGKGIDPDVVKRKAFEKGLVDEQRLESLTDAEAVQLVFAPGFSTAEQVSNLSGRGVGMDVVKSSLEKVGGQVRLTSEKGKGTRIQLSLPLSMSVSNVMMVQIAGQQYGVPMDAVVETVRVAAKDIHGFKDQRTAVLRGRIVPLYDANQLLRSDSMSKPNEDDEFAVLVVRVGGQTVGIIVDGFAQTIDVILKPLEGPLANLPGFSGSALLGDGSVLLVLNLKELL